MGDLESKTGGRFAPDFDSTFGRIEANATTTTSTNVAEDDYSPIAAGRAV